MDAKPLATDEFRLLIIIHDVVAMTILGRAVAQLAVAPSVPRAVLMYFIPPTLAFLFITFNVFKKKKAHPTILAWCHVFWE